MPGSERVLLCLLVWYPGNALMRNKVSSLSSCSGSICNKAEHTNKRMLHWKGGASRHRSDGGLQ